VRSFALLLVVSTAFLVLLVPGGSARPETTNPGAYLTVRLTVTNKGIQMSTTRGRRGSTAIFLLSNQATNSRVLAVGDASLTHRRGTGFAIKLAKNERRRVLLYLTYRGPLPVSVGDAGKAKVLGVFRVV
jgi:hypothetical protein